MSTRGSIGPMAIHLHSDVLSWNNAFGNEDFNRRKDGHAHREGTSRSALLVLMAG